jgi:hypothetical protein
MQSRTDLDRDWRSIPWVGTGITQGLPAAACSLLGLLCGQMLRKAQDFFTQARIAGMGALLLAAAFIGVRLGQPFSKDFFTPTYVLLAAGSGCVLIAVLSLCLDAAAMRQAAARWVSPLTILGTNAITVYGLHELLWPTVMMRWRALGPDGIGYHLYVALNAWMKHFTTPMVGPWLTTFCYLACYWLLLLWMHRRNIHIRL